MNWYRGDVEEFRKAAEADMRKAILFVQLLNEFRGRTLAGSTTTAAALQYDLARTLGLPILQWRPLELVTARLEDSQHRRLLESHTVIACDLPEFEALVVRRVRELLSPAPPRVSTGRTEVDKLIFVNSARVDSELAREVGEALMALGAWVALPIFVGEPSEVCALSGRAASPLRRRS